MKFLLISIFLISNLSHATDLASGSKVAAAEFDVYKSESKGCDTSLQGKRALLTGFGRFQGISFNATGLIVSNIADPQVWPDTVPLNAPATVEKTKKFSDFAHPNGHGARIYNRNITIGDTLFNLCVLELDVLWDVSGAIVSYEMNRFQPEVVLMSGIGGSTLEAGARNTAIGMIGYSADGKGNSNNLPAGRSILEYQARDSALPMTWNNFKILEGVKPYLETSHISIGAAFGARPENNYICNHVSYVALATANNWPIILAGGLIELEPKLSVKPIIGFFHIPTNLSESTKQVTAWGSLMTSMIYFMAKP